AVGTSSTLDLPLSSGDFPRSLASCLDHLFLVVTDQGSLYSYNTATCQWSLVLQDPVYSSYSLLEVSTQGMVAMGSLAGTIKVFFIRKPSACWETAVYDGKVLSLTWMEQSAETVASPGHLLSCGPEGEVIWWTTYTGTEAGIAVQKTATFQLPYSRQRWLTCALLSQVDSTVVCGDRRGSLHCYRKQEGGQPTQPFQSLLGIHGKTGVTSVQMYRSHVYSTAEMGTTDSFSVCGTGLQLLKNNRVYKGFDWLEKLTFSKGGEVLAMGFHTSNFVVWSLSTNEPLLQVQCGGGHRAWGILPSSCQGALFAYIKTRSIQLTKGPSISGKKRLILKDSLHGREITCLKFLGWATNNEVCPQHATSGSSQCASSPKLLFSGGGRAQLMCYRVSVSSYRVHKGKQHSEKDTCTPQNMQTNTQQIRHLPKVDVPVKEAQGCTSVDRLSDASASKFDPGNNRRVQEESTDDHCDTTDTEPTTSDVECHIEYLTSHNLVERRKRKKKSGAAQLEEEEEVEMRYMALTAWQGRQGETHAAHLYFVAAACSDGFLRLFVYDDRERRMQLFCVSDFHHHCVLSLDHFFTTTPDGTTHTHVLSGATDGQTAVWNVTPFLSSVYHPTPHDIRVPETVEASAKVSQILSTGTTESKDGTNASTIDSPVLKMKLNSGFPGKTSKLKMDSPDVLLQNHQSGVNAISIRRVDSDHYLLASGGDDNSLQVTVLAVQEDTPNEPVIVTMATSSVLSAHAATITAVPLIQSDPDGGRRTAELITGRSTDEPANKLAPCSSQRSTLASASLSQRYATDARRMSYTDDKKPLPPYAGPPADPEADFKNVADYQKKLKKWLVVGAVFLVLLVTGATLLGVYLSKDSNRILTADRKLKYDGKVLDEKVEVDVNLKTETFYTKSEDGETTTMYDTKNDLAAYKFTGLHICFVLEDSTYNEDEVEQMANDVQNNNEGEVEEAESGGQVNITLDESRGKVDKTILSEKMLDFCKGHEIYWAIARQEGQAAAEEGAASSRQKRGVCLSSSGPDQLSPEQSHCTGQNRRLVESPSRALLLGCISGGVFPGERPKPRDIFGEAFCEFIQRRGRQFEDKKVIEVGAGTGLVGIVASLMGADVTLTDLKSILPNMEENVKINTEGCKHRPKVCELEWGRELHKYTKGQYDYVIGTDVVYEEHMFRSLVVTLKHLCDQKTRVLLCHHVRWPDKDEKFMKLFSESFTIVNQRRLPKQDLTVYLFEAKLKGTH
ncbi:WD repeat-containing protein 6, partial [Branchiostoma belcheri]